MPTPVTYACIFMSRPSQETGGLEVERLLQEGEFRLALWQRCDTQDFEQLGPVRRAEAARAEAEFVGHQRRLSDALAAVDLAETRLFQMRQQIGEQRYQLLF